MMPSVNQQSGTGLHDLMNGLVDARTAEALRGISVTGVAIDSREVTAGSLFIALKGRRAHGADYVRQAVANGAVAVAWEGDETQRDVIAAVDAADAVFIRVDRLGEKCSEIAARFYGHPSRALNLVGVTGTDGKTSVSHFIAQCLHSETAPCGVLGTLGNGLMGRLEPTGLTTADPVKVQQSLAALVSAGARSAVMEVSSHGLDQRRVASVHFDTAVFTNLAQDHLDYHGDMAAYAAAKAKLFAQPGLATAVVNLDDAAGRDIAANCAGRVEVWGYSCGRQSAGFEDLADKLVTASGISTTDKGLAFELVTPEGSARVETGLLGRFNVSNALAVIAVLLDNGVPFEQAVRRLSTLEPVPGRMQRIERAGCPAVIVDYAHTPQALQACCEALREHFHTRLVCVFGCGGNRDSGKRPQMAAVAERYADEVIVTNDNPRHEDPEHIAADIMRGFSAPEKVRQLLDRREAIALALRQAGEGDVVLIAGKGHENCQLIGDARFEFDDAAVAAELMEARA